MRWTVAMGLAAAMLTTGCETEENTPETPAEITVPETYTFTSKLIEGEDSVSYSGQTARHVLIADLKSYIGSLTDAIDAGEFTPTDDGEVVARLRFYFEFDSESDGGENLRLSTDPASSQGTYEAISAGKNLVDKFAGNASKTDHKDWTKEFWGWSEYRSTAEVLNQWFEELEDLAIAHANGDIRTYGDEQLPVHVTSDGRDLQQLIQKFLLGAIAFSQAADDYLDSDVDGKGLLQSNVDADEGKPYSKLEHGWDEAFGYFGAARDYAAYTDDEIAGKGGRDDWQGYHDTDGDGKIDLESEYNFGASVNAAKRDRASAESAKTDYTTEVFEAFLKGRALLAATNGELSAEQLAALEGHRDTIVLGWEKAYAATCVHYINDTLQDLNTIGTDDFSLATLAKHWSELKGFALSFQFNPRSPMTDEQFMELHGRIGTGPVFEGDVDAFKADLLAARALLGSVYEFDAANLGDNAGEGGW